MNRTPNCICSICKKDIYRRPSQILNGRVFCSLQCSGKSQQKARECPICKSHYIGNKKTCSRTCANKSRAGIKYTKEGLFNKAYQGTLLKEKVAKERGGLCEVCKFNNYAVLQVHHIKERHLGGSNEMSNLKLLCPNCHTTHHLGTSIWKKH